MHRNLIAIVSLSLLAMGGCPAPGGEGGGGGSPLAFLPFVLIFVLFYFLILRPQQKQSKKKEEMLKSLKRGDNVITAGGIYGRIMNISEDDIVTLEISKGVNIRIARSGIAGPEVQGKEEPKDKEDKSKK
ncbi:MAG TPA: preprotein translocase subunit YajC [Thermodesulfobacteriota bacterium]|nr:preprotein translocase subunit YajC [Thermodesulfobacteriota bacterium]